MKAWLFLLKLLSAGKASYNSPSESPMDNVLAQCETPLIGTEKVIFKRGPCLEKFRLWKIFRLLLN